MNYNWDWGVFFKSTGVGSETYGLVHHRSRLDHRHCHHRLDHRLAAGLAARRDAYRAKPPGVRDCHRLRRAVPQRTAAGAAVHLVLPGAGPAARGPAGMVQARPQPDHLGADQRGHLPGPVHRCAGLRTGAYRYPGAAPRPGSRRPGDGLQPGADLQQRAAAASLPDHHSAAYLGILERVQELFGGLADRPDGVAGADQANRRVLRQPVRGVHPGYPDLFHPEHGPDAADAHGREESLGARPDLCGGK